MTETLTPATFLLYDWLARAFGWARGAIPIAGFLFTERLSTSCVRGVKLGVMALREDGVDTRC
jgi:hypothetical protein